MSYNICKSEEEIAKYWADNDSFKESLRQSKGKPEFIFYDGPPFATGLPHYGHILAGTIKDVICRYKHQRGFHVERRFGWDCHGLPVEFEIEKIHNIKTSEEIEKIGIDTYNGYCRDIVMKYSKEWESTVTRLGRWIDFENDYKTMYKSYMEGVWSVFSRLWEKGLVYNGYKVMPYSVGCRTVLSNFEAKLNYKQVHDPNITVKFMLDERIDDRLAYFLVFTTTPWTLPSNEALCVNADGRYKRVIAESGDIYIVREDFELKGLVLSTISGSDLKDICYRFIYNSGRGIGRVVCDNYVEMDSGTGVVHIAPAFGEDDYRVCLENKIVSKDDRIGGIIDDECKFTTNVDDLLTKGLFVKDTDKMIIADLKFRAILYDNKSVIHSYPYCWRSETPLIYRAVPSWFVDVTSLIDRMVENNNQTDWTPDNIRTGRFHNWLNQARDWAISRNRYWGTPLPIWRSEDSSQVICISSSEELMEKSGITGITDLHRDHIDDITIPDPRGSGYPRMKRIKEVFDCWFESGSVPFASHLDGKYEFKQADFIGEGLDQCRGFFYTLMILSTALENKPAFKNLIVNGLVLAEDGQKMSKSKKNYPSVTETIEKYGSDAIRMYLMSSPATHAQDLKFSNKDMSPIVNGTSILLNSVMNFIKTSLISDANTSIAEDLSIMDRWILRRLNIYHRDVEKDFSEYKLNKIVQNTISMIDDLANWYIKLNRKSTNTVAILIDSMLNISYIFAPIAPFLTEKIFLELRGYRNINELSVHYLTRMPVNIEVVGCDIDDKEINLMKKNIEVIRMVRLKLKRSIAGAIHTVFLSHVFSEEIKKYIRKETNVINIKQIDEGSMIYKKIVCIDKELGMKFGSKSKEIKKLVANLSKEDILSFENTGNIEINYNLLSTNELKIEKKAKDTDDTLSVSYDNTIVIVSTLFTEEMKSEAALQVLIQDIKKYRKSRGAKLGEKIIIKEKELCDRIGNNKEMIENVLSVKFIQ